MEALSLTTVGHGAGLAFLDEAALVYSAGAGGICVHDTETGTQVRRGARPQKAAGRGG